LTKTNLMWPHLRMSNEERRERYQSLRGLGFSPTWAQKIRDWNNCHVTQICRAMEKGEIKYGYPYNRDISKAVKRDKGT